KYIAYFQSYTNTYGDLARLERIFTEAALHPDICALSIGTRPDCVGDDVIAMLERVKAAAGKPVWVELGLQTIHEETARFIRRGYALPVFDDAVKRLRAAGLEVIVHVILGLPGETAADMLETVKYVGACDIQGIKLQLLHVMKGTELGRMYEAGGVCPAGAVSENRRIVNDPADNEKTEMKSGHRYLYISSPEEYIGILTDALELLPPHIVIHRLTGDAPHESLLFPRWSANKRLTLNGVIREMKLRDTMQGRLSDRAQTADKQETGSR
ncbi:MAG: radical SAM protein, partial [Lachnospiraceae bacterium]|nr:radical SAM protein [Lachnospiraceae bacterium]